MTQLNSGRTIWLLSPYGRHGTGSSNPRGEILTGDSSVFGFVHLGISEVNRLADGKCFSPQEMAALLALADKLHDAVLQAICAQEEHPNLLAPLGLLANHQRIELLLMRGVSPRIVRGIRNRRYASYCSVWHVAKKDFEIASRHIRTQYADASEWPSFAKEERRLLRAEWLFARLWLAGVKYRLGFRTDMKRLTDQIAALLVDLPNRRDCIA